MSASASLGAVNNPKAISSARMSERLSPCRHAARKPQGERLCRARRLWRRRVPELVLVTEAMTMIYLSSKGIR
ncbi:MAG: hypothetical protein BWY79_01425 [Actinobacteria bacterium ADurb.Bin444]|nr:MAG: hypothetical protein BWY79_01425 [Actinobacteria bacterium ADurb.Bin444]